MYQGLQHYLMREYQPLSEKVRSISHRFARLPRLLTYTLECPANSENRTMYHYIVNGTSRVAIWFTAPHFTEISIHLPFGNRVFIYTRQELFTEQWILWIDGCTHAIVWYWRIREWEYEVNRQRSFDKHDPNMFLPFMRYPTPCSLPASDYKEVIKKNALRDIDSLDPL